jgi:hypothetical protein
VGEEPEDEREGGAEQEAGDDREIEGGVFAAMNDVAGKAAESEGELSTEVEKGAEEDKQGANEEEGAAEFAKGIHGKESRGNEVRK